MTKRKNSFFRPGFFAFPYVVICALFVILPLVLVLVYAFIGADGSFTFENFKQVFSPDSGNLKLLLQTVLIAAATTAICLVIAYPVALVLASSPFNKYVILALLFIIPMWMNFVLRVIALKSLLYVLGIKEGPLAVLIGMCYDFLPFMLLPIYTVLTKLDKSYFEASADLGANGFVTFFKVTLPLSAGGIMSGVTMVFMPVFSAYAITNMMGDSSTNVIGNKIDILFKTTSTWGVGSALSFVLLVLVFLVMVISSLASAKTAKATQTPALKGGERQ